MIKLTDILREYRSTKGVEKYLKDLETNPKGEDGFFSQRVRVIKSLEELDMRILSDYYKEFNAR